MRLLIWFLILVSSSAQAQILPGMVPRRSKVVITPPAAPKDTARFSWGKNRAAVTGWNVGNGDPHLAQKTVTDAATGRTMRTVDPGNWTNYQNNSANNANGEANAGNGIYPSTIFASYDFTYSTIRDVNTNPSYIIGGLIPGESYRIHGYGTRAASGVTGAYRLMEIHMKDANGVQIISNYNSKGNNSLVYTTKDDNATMRGGIWRFDVIAAADGTVQFAIVPGAAASGDPLTIAYNGWNEVIKN